MGEQKTLAGRVEVSVPDERKTEIASANLGRVGEQKTLACRVELSVAEPLSLDPCRTRSGR